MCRILIVEDESLVAMDLEMQLRALEATRASEARSQAAAVRGRQAALHSLKATQAAIAAAQVRLMPAATVHMIRSFACFPPWDCCTSMPVFCFPSAPRDPRVQVAL